MHRLTTKPTLSSLMPRQHWRGLVCLVLCLTLAACGFRLKGTAPLPFSTLYTNINDNSEFGANLLRAISASSPGIQFVDVPADAQARLTQLRNSRSLRELSIDAEGQVEEYELNLEFVFQLTDNQGHVVLPPTILRSTRELPYDPDATQAKEGEITMVFRDMQQSLISQIVRRLSSPEVNEAYENSASLPVDDAMLQPEPASDATTEQPDLDSLMPRSAPQIQPYGNAD